MRIGIYSREGCHETALALEIGWKALGFRCVHLSSGDHKDGQTGSFDVVMSLGLRDKGKQIVADYEKRGTPVFVLDFGYTRGTDHWQISFGGLNKPPPFACPSDRWDALGIELQPPVSREGPRVLCEQTVGDAVHPFDTAEKLEAWASSVDCDERRPHPIAAAELGVDVEPLPAMLGRASEVITWNSNVGHEALIAGVPVKAHGDAAYSGVTTDDRPAYFARVAYGQWTPEEMRAGLPQRFVRDHWLPGIPPAALSGGRDDERQEVQGQEGQGQAEAIGHEEQQGTSGGAQQDAASPPVFQGRRAPEKASRHRKGR